MLTTTDWRDDQRHLARPQLLDYARWHIRSLACQHGALSPGGWGNNWQSALWAVTAGQAGWLLWDELNDQERAYVGAMVISEADYASARGPRYFRNRLGQELTPGDSQSDAVSWDLMAPALALAMMPEHGSARKWRDALIGMSIAAFARPDDLHREQTVNGVRLDIRLPGTNANEDGTVTNHGIVNPDYIQNVQHLWWAASLLRAGDVAVPEALFLNADIVYRALAVVEFPHRRTRHRAARSTSRSGRSTTRWGSAGAPVVRPPSSVSTRSRTRTRRRTCARASSSPRTPRDTRALQLRWTDGHIYADGPSEESYRLGKEEYALQQMALAWWAGSVKDGLRMRVDTHRLPGHQPRPGRADPLAAQLVDEAHALGVVRQQALLERLGQRRGGLVLGREQQLHVGPRQPQGRDPAGGCRARAPGRRARSTGSPRWPSR